MWIFVHSDLIQEVSFIRWMKTWRSRRRETLSRKACFTSARTSLKVLKKQFIFGSALVVKASDWSSWYIYFAGCNPVLDGTASAQNGLESDGANEEYTLMSIDTIINGKVSYSPAHDVWATLVVMTQYENDVERPYLSFCFSSPFLSHDPFFLFIFNLLFLKILFSVCNDRFILVVQV